jgi:hypothetical protein
MYLICRRESLQHQSTHRVTLIGVMKFRALPAIGLLVCFGFVATAQQKPGLVISTGVPPKAGPTEYQGQAQAGTVTLGADFTGHSVATPDATFTSDQYIVFEVGLFGKAGDRVTLSPEQFSLKINGKKSVLESVPFAMIFGSLKDPEWEESQAAAKVEKSKTSIGGGGGGGADDPKPAPPKMSITELRAMQQKVQKSAMPEGDRPLPQAGLLFFQYGGNIKKINSLELMYNGSAGKARLTIQQ